MDMEPVRGSQAAQEALFYSMSISLIVSGIAVYAALTVSGWILASIMFLVGFVVTFTITPPLTANWLNVNVDDLLASR